MRRAASLAAVYLTENSPAGCHHEPTITGHGDPAGTPETEYERSVAGKLTHQWRAEIRTLIATSGYFYEHRSTCHNACSSRPTMHIADLRCYLRAHRRPFVSTKTFPARHVLRFNSSQLQAIIVECSRVVPDNTNT